MDSTMCFSLVLFAIAFFAGHVTANCPCDALMTQNQNIQPSDPQYCPVVTNAINCYTKTPECSESPAYKALKPMEQQTKQMCAQIMQAGAAKNAMVMCSKKQQECAAASGFTQGMSGDGPTDQDIKDNKDGICDKAPLLVTCMTKLMETTCKSQAESVKQMVNSIKQTSEKCQKVKDDGGKKMTTDDGKKMTTDDGAKDSATSAQLSLLLLVLPVLHTFF